MNAILEKWGINLSEEKFLPDSLISNFPERIYFIDKLPLTVSQENGYKLDEVDISYKDIKRKIAKTGFLLIENKYISILTKLWLYNKVFVGAHVYSNDELKKINKKYIRRYKKFQNEIKRLSLIELTSKTEMDFFVRLGTRDVAQATFYFSEYELIIMPSWSCFIIYFNNLNKFEIVKDIVKSEGMFLRAFEK